jgi:hypothetical protein
VLGRSHALSGAVAGIVLGSLVRHEPAGSLATLCGLTAAATKYGGTPAYITYGDGGAGIRPSAPPGGVAV